MTVLAWPSGLRGPAEFDFWIDVDEVAHGDENPTSSGLMEVVTRFGRVRAEVTWSYTTPAQAGAIEAHLAQMRGRRNPSTVPNYKYRAQLGSAAGAWVLATSAAAGAESITIGAGSGTFSAGDWVEISQTTSVPRAHMVLAHIGNVLEIAPPLHEATSAGKPVRHLGDGVTTIIRDTMELLTDVGPVFRLSAGPPGAVDKRTIQLVSSRRAVFAAAPSLLTVPSQLATPYKSSAFVASQLATPYQAETFVSSQLAMPYQALEDAATLVASQLATPYQAEAYVSSQLATPYVAAASATTVTSMQFAQAPTDSRYFDPTFIDQAEAAGLGIFGIRHNITITWSGTAPNNLPTGAPYDWSGYVPQWDKMQAKGLKLYATLFEGGSGGVYPTTTAQLNAWAAQALSAAQYLRANYPGMLIALEVENEPDGSWPIPAASYPPIAAALHTAIRSDPTLNNVMIAGPTTIFDDQYDQDVIDGGLLNSIDWWSRHMYTANTTFEDRMASLRARFGAGHANMPVMISEYGLHHAAVAYQVAGDLTCLKAAGVSATAYYTGKDYGGPAGTDYGLLLSTGGISSQGTAFKVWHANIGSAATFIGRDDLASNVRSYHFIVAT